MKITKVIILSIAGLVASASTTTSGMVENYAKNFGAKFWAKITKEVDFDLAVEMVYAKKSGLYDVGVGGEFRFRGYRFGELEKFYNSEFFVKYADNPPLEDSKKFGDFREFKRKAKEKGINLLSFRTRWYRKTGLFARLCNYPPEFWFENYGIYFVPKALAEQIEQK